MKADASARSYARLIGPNEETAILVDAPPKEEDYAKFLRLAAILHNEDLCVPQPLLVDYESGFFVISDLGKQTVADCLISRPETQQLVFESVVNVLCRLREIETDGLTKMTTETAVQMLSPVFDYYGATGRSDVESALGSAYAKYVDGPFRLSLRDFHAENLIWRPDQTGLQCLGLLDFQDAFLAPEGYDLASMTRDARRQVPISEQRKLEATFAQRANLHFEKLRLQVALLAIQRNLRILGMFAKLSHSGRGQYLKLMPTVWTYIINDLERAELAELRDVVLAHVPAPVEKGSR